MRLLPTGHIGGPQVFSTATDTTLLTGEPDGLAIDFTGTADFALSTWAMQAVQERNAGVDSLQSPHVFFSNGATTPKYVKTSTTGIGWSPHNYITVSQDLDNGLWSTFDGASVSANATTAPDGTSTADQVTFGGSADSQVYQSTATPAAGSVVYTLSVYAKTASGTQDFRLKVSDDGGNHWSSDKTATTTWQRFTYTFTLAGNISNLSPAHAPLAGGTHAIFFWGAQLNRGESATAYIATTTAKYGLPISYGEGLLVEPAATNIHLASEDFGSAYYYVAEGTKATDVAIAPDGSTTADAVILASGAGQRGIFGTNSAITVSSATQYTYSLYIKKGGLTFDWFEINLTGMAVDLRCWFNLTTGAKGTSSGSVDGYTITAIGNGWYRLTATFTTNTTTLASFNQVAVSDGSNTGLASGDDVTPIYYIWGFQVETGSVATSYYPTVGSSQTRSADSVNAATSTYPHSATANTAYIRAITRDAGDFRSLFHMTDATSNERIMCYRFSGTTDVYSQIVDNTSTQMTTVHSGAATNNAVVQMTFAWATNDCATSANGSVASPDTSVTLPTVTTLHLGHDRNTTHLNGLVTKFITVPRRISNGTLPTWRYA